jgi:hypothetical protein
MIHHIATIVTDGIVVFVSICTPYSVDAIVYTADDN